VNATATKAVAEVLSTQSTQPTTKPGNAPKARVTYTYGPPASGSIAANSAVELASISW
jgi:hypothetical protein